jgi:hypothetical protein
MTLTYRTAGAWGAGKGSNLTATEVDGNFYDLDQRVVDLEENPPVPNEISNITVSGTQMTIYLEGGASFGPFTLPQANFRPSIVAALPVATDGTYTPVLSDANKYLRCTEGGGCTVILPSNASVAFPVDTEITFRQASAGAVVFDAPTEVTIHSVPGYLPKTAQLGASVTLKKIATDEWELVGWLAADVTA